MLTACSNTMSGGSPTLSVVASPEWAQHQDFLDTLEHRVKSEWHANITMDKVHPPAGTTVTVEIRYYADGGEPAPISISGGDRKSERACARALMKVKEAWTPEMIKSLGDHQTMTFTFVYP